MTHHLNLTGLALFSKYQPTNLHFEKFATNGNPFKLLHGDWFTGKGVGYALIPINGYNFHLFNTHVIIKRSLCDHF